MHEVVAAVSAVLRVPAESLGRSPHARSLVWEACRELCPVTLAEVAAELGVGKRSLCRRVPVAREALQRVRTVLLDPRSPVLHGGSHLWHGPWVRYGRRRGLPTLPG